jgi:hypothetical protein
MRYYTRRTAREAYRRRPGPTWSPPGECLFRVDLPPTVLGVGDSFSVTYTLPL